MQPVKAITLKLCAVVLFIVMSSLIKATSDAVPAGEAVFFRSLLAIPVTLIWLVMLGELSTGLRVRSVWGHVRRGVTGTLAVALSFVGLGLLPLPEVTALNYSSSLLVVIFAALFLGERVGIFRISAVLVGLIGVIIILAPKLSIFGGAPVQRTEVIGAVVVLAGATCAAFAQITIRKLVQTEHPAAIAFYFSVTATALSLLSAPFGWVWPAGWPLVQLILAGVFGGMAQIFLTLSYRYADASIVAPFDYASMVFALGIGYFIFDEVPTAAMLIGAALIAAAGIAIILREHHLGLKRGRARALRTPQG
ncbi:EamA family transporter [Pelagivirga sediminicola]|uniref:EamA family transporter n=1 Tax=Pelagivirga sediminicola TaxID=2170575 RepID=A0A2T7G8S6_9RHOB|nr:DMT family transporter [Pelagivirga sediminicola]PVA10801.1 EamA family transporter [Pelagivirga sediminicola]